MSYLSVWSHQFATFSLYFIGIYIHFEIYNQILHVHDSFFFMIVLTFLSSEFDHAIIPSNKIIYLLFS